MHRADWRPMRSAAALNSTGWPLAPSRAQPMDRERLVGVGARNEVVRALADQARSSLRWPRRLEGAGWSASSQAAAGQSSARAISGVPSRCAITSKYAGTARRRSRLRAARSRRAAGRGRWGRGPAPEPWPETPTSVVLAPLCDVSATLDAGQADARGVSDIRRRPPAHCLVLRRRSRNHGGSSRATSTPLGIEAPERGQQLRPGVLAPAAARRLVAAAAELVIAASRP